MSTLKTTNLQHPSAASPAIVLDADGNATVAGMGLVLVKPTSIANSGGSASLSGGAVTLSGVNSVSLNGVFTSAYTNYLVTSNLSSTGATDVVTIRVRASGTDLSTSTYEYGQAIITTSSIGFNAGSASDTSIRIQALSGAGNTHFSDIRFLAPQTATRTQIYYNSNQSSAFGLLGFGEVKNTTAYDGFTVLFSTGAASGTIRVYGYNNG